MHLIRSAAKKNSTLKGTRMLPWKLELLLSPRLTANQLAQFVWSVALLPRLHTKPRSKYSWNCSEQLHKSYSNNCGKYSVHHIDTYIIGGGATHTFHYIVGLLCVAMLDHVFVAHWKHGTTVTCGRHFRSPAVIAARHFEHVRWAVRPWRVDCCCFCCPIFSKERSNIEGTKSLSEAQYNWTCKKMFWLIFEQQD